MVVSAESPALGAVLILDRDGVRVAGSYFEDQFRTLAQQQVECMQHALAPRPLWTSDNVELSCYHPCVFSKCRAPP